MTATTDAAEPAMTGGPQPGADLDPGLRAPLRLHALAYGLGVSAAVVASARLRVADALGEEPATADELAEALGVNSSSLTQLLRALSCHGVFEQVAGGLFRHNELSRLLRADEPGSRRDMVLLAGAPFAWRVWSGLDQAVRTGESIFPAFFGKDLFTYLTEDDPESGRIFDRAMTSGAQAGAAVVARLDVAGARLVADLGGGQGGVLRGLLERHEGLHGMLVDLPKVLATADAALRPGGSLGDRCRLVPADCREAVPGGADLYLMKHVLHMWDDETARTVLCNLAASAGPGTRVAVVEHLLDTAPDPAVATTMDLLMLVNLGGRERTRTEFAGLFAGSGIRLDAVEPTGTAAHLILGTVAG
jgi:C-methyltransferase